MSTVEAGKVVSFHYTLTNPNGDVLDTSDGDEPLVYLHGAKNIVVGLEAALDGKAVGDKVQTVVPPKEGYGEAEGPGPQGVPRSAFPEGVELSVGMNFEAEADDGSVMLLWIVAIGDDEVMVDGNHPLAGQTLHFDVEILEVRDATDEEKAHGHSHGPGGHDH
ncbi:MAG: peptidylprolyl isomerase [Proteobacteria bacterium]|nr:peptidylprolyl isomerase [Pseudomonadota bacterium]